MLTNNASTDIGELINVASVDFNKKQLVTQENKVITESAIAVESLDDFFNT